jgi:hypothetical protein
MTLISLKSKEGTKHVSYIKSPNINALISFLT